MTSFDQWADDLANHIASKSPQTPTVEKKSIGLLTNEQLYSRLKDMEMWEVSWLIQNYIMHKFVDYEKQDKELRIFLQEIISGSFIWSNTKQGIDFWQEISDKLRKG